MCRKKTVIYRVWYNPQFQASTGGFGIYPSQIRGDYCKELLKKKHKNQIESRKRHEQKIHTHKKDIKMALKNIKMFKFTHN